mmetsp:Transcript_121061/g.353775  ORF Transcript_121061/g.353775 Transcript_121061/m.353775 type:complete len:223 (-) Transcript_121061:236-904(-)
MCTPMLSRMKRRSNRLGNIRHWWKSVLAQDTGHRCFESGEFRSLHMIQIHRCHTVSVMASVKNTKVMSTTAAVAHGRQYRGAAQRQLHCTQRQPSCCATRHPACEWRPMHSGTFAVMSCVSLGSGTGTRATRPSSASSLPTLGSASSSPCQTGGTRRLPSRSGAAAEPRSRVRDSWRRPSPAGAAASGGTLCSGAAASPSMPSSARRAARRSPRPLTATVPP